MARDQAIRQPTLMMATIAAAALLTPFMAPIGTGAAARTVIFRSLAGRSIEASLNESSQRPAPAVVLVGMLGRSRDDWQAVGQRLADARITTLAIDLPAAVVPATTEALAQWSDDVRGALNFLAARSDTRPGSIGVMGAGLGASLAVIAAAADPRIRSLALISPSLDYRGLRIEDALREYGVRPAYLVASRLDPYSARSAREMAKNAPGIRELQIAEASGSGTVLLSRDSDLVQAVIEWFQRTLG